MCFDYYAVSSGEEFAVGVVGCVCSFDVVEGPMEGGFSIDKLITKSKAL